MADIPVGPEDRQMVTFHIDGTDYETHTTRKFRERKPWTPVDKSKITTLIPGQILRVLVRPGQRVRRGEGVVVLEAMKMSNELTSPWEGTVKTIHVQEGQKVVKNELLIELI